MGDGDSALKIGSSVLNNKLVVYKKIYVVLNTKDGEYDAILYHKDIHVLVSSCVNFCFAHGPIFANSIIKNDFNCISLRQDLNKERN